MAAPGGVIKLEARFELNRNAKNQTSDALNTLENSPVFPGNNDDTLISRQVVQPDQDIFNINKVVIGAEEIPYAAEASFINTGSLDLKEYSNLLKSTDSLPLVTEPSAARLKSRKSPRTINRTVDGGSIAILNDGDSD